MIPAIPFMPDGVCHYLNDKNFNSIKDITDVEISKTPTPICPIMGEVNITRSCDNLKNLLRKRTFQKKMACIFDPTNAKVASIHVSYTHLFESRKSAQTIMHNQPAVKRISGNPYFMPNTRCQRSHNTFMSNG